MIVRKIDDVPAIPYGNGAQKRIVIGRNEGAPTFVMRVFDVIPGGASSDHSHPYEHEVMILKGEATLKSDAGDHKVAVGNVFFIPADERHQLVNTGKDTLRFVCLVPLAGEEEYLK